ncbi:MAG: hypothetical protein ACRDK3_10930 [Actinomycetota bacterium]
MLLFRSEEHRDSWLSDRDLEHGASMTVAQQWNLARRWYAHRMAPDWRRRTPDEIQALFESLGLTGPFWRLS